MIAKVALEFQDNGTFKHVGTLNLEVTFARVRLNAVMELVDAFVKWCYACQAPLGTYRIGGDDAATIEWNGRSPKIVTPVAAGVVGEEASRIATEEALRAFKEGN